MAGRSRLSPTVNLVLLAEECVELLARDDPAAADLEVREPAPRISSYSKSRERPVTWATSSTEYASRAPGGKLVEIPDS